MQFINLSIFAALSLGALASPSAQGQTADLARRDNMGCNQCGSDFDRCYESPVSGTLPFQCRCANNGATCYTDIPDCYDCATSYGSCLKDDIGDGYPPVLCKCKNGVQCGLYVWAKREAEAAPAPEIDVALQARQEFPRCTCDDKVNCYNNGIENDPPWVCTCASTGQQCGWYIWV